MRESAPGVRWIPPRNLHITVEFLGPTNDEQLNALAAEMTALMHPPFSLRFADLVVLPNPRIARVVALACSPSDPFESLCHVVRAATLNAGFSLKPQRISPHLTIARLRRTDREWLSEYVTRGREGVGEIPPLDVRQVHLYESTLSRAGTEYSSLLHIPLVPS